MTKYLVVHTGVAAQVVADHFSRGGDGVTVFFNGDPDDVEDENWVAVVPPDAFWKKLEGKDAEDI